MNRAIWAICGLTVSLTILSTQAQEAVKQPVPEAEQGEGVSLTVYNQDFVVVRERRMLELPKGRGTVRFRDVAATIVPETVQFTPLGKADAARVVDQSYEFDLVSADRLLDKFIDQSITVVTQTGDELKGKLLTFDNGHLTLQGLDGGVDLVPRGGNIKDVQFAKLPEGLLTKPTLVWNVDGKVEGKQLVKVAYAATKMTWHVDYRARVNATGDKLDLAGWVTVKNQTGTTFKEAQVKLMAGELHVKNEDESTLGRRMIPAGDTAPTSPRPFTQREFAEYHLYALGRKTTLADHATKQIELLDIATIPVTRHYVVPRNEARVAVLLGFRNSDKTVKDLGIPLPKGPVRVFQKGGDGAFEFVGEDGIDHTPKEEWVKLRLNYAFDLKVQRKTLAERINQDRHEYDMEVRLRNHKAEPVKIEVLEPTQHQTWTMMKNSLKYVVRDSRTLQFDADVPANGETVITYTIRYSVPQPKDNVRPRLWGDGDLEFPRS
jgi:hypothetical protein